METTALLTQILKALEFSFYMFWEIFWALVLGFALSAIVQAVVSKKQISNLLPDSKLKSLTIATALGAASSSCSYAAVALTRSIIQKGANFVAGMAFQMASTNLVVELSIIMIILLGWQFFMAELAGGILIVAIMALFFKKFVQQKQIETAVEHANKGILGKMEGHAAMDMALTEGTLLNRIFSKKGITVISHFFIMDWLAIWKDIVLGILIAGAIAAWVPNDFWASFFLENHPTISKFWGPFVGPIVAIFSFVCSIGNVPLAAVLWQHGISFGGVIAFIYSDLIIIAILHIYYKYYGFKMACTIFWIYYATIVLASITIDLIFQLLNIIPNNKNIIFSQMSIHFNYTTILNIIFGCIMAFLIYYFLKTDGLKMLKMMNKMDKMGKMDMHSKKKSLH